MQLFAGRYWLLSERIGGQNSLVQFASNQSGGFAQYAIKFFFDQAAFNAEAAVHAHVHLREIAPRRIDEVNGLAELDVPAGLVPEHAAASDDVLALAGCVYPPFLVTERGMPLEDTALWLSEGPQQAAALAFLQDVARLLEQVHAEGYVHCRVGPRTVLLLLQSQAWRLCGFRDMRAIGTLPSLRACLPPQLFRSTLAALHSHLHV